MPPPPPCCRHAAAMLPPRCRHAAATATLLLPPLPPPPRCCRGATVVPPPQCFHRRCRHAAAKLPPPPHATATAAAAAPLPLPPPSYNNHEVEMRALISLALQVMDVQQRQWGGWATSAARGRDNNGNNDDYSIPAAALAEYPNLWHTNPYNGGGDRLTPSLGSSPGQYASLFGNLPVVGDRLYHCGGGRFLLWR
jgi:hypothetical protein